MNNTELQDDIQMLHDKHGVSHLLTQSLTANPKEAQECIRFFKQMMYLLNGGLMTLGLLFVLYGLTHRTYIAYVLIFVGSVLIIRFAFVFMRQANAVLAMEHLCKKHYLTNT